MKLQITRNVFTPKFVVGRISVNGHFNGFTSEGVNGIPVGEYRVTIDDYGLLVHVVGHENVRIGHDDCSNCIKIGRTVNLQTGVLVNSEATFHELIEKVKKESGSNEIITLEIKEIK